MKAEEGNKNTEKKNTYSMSHPKDVMTAAYQQNFLNVGVLIVMIAQITKPAQL